MTVSDVLAPWGAINAALGLSAVLAGKRALNLRQTQALARRFAVPMDALAA